MKKLLPLIKKDRVAEMLDEAEKLIEPFLKTFVPSMLSGRLGVQDVFVVGESGGERTFTAQHRGHSIEIKTIGASPGRPLGMGIEVRIDGLVIPLGTAYKPIKSIEAYLRNCYTDSSEFGNAVALLQVGRSLGNS